MKTKEMKITKRSGQEVPFDITKIENAIRKASQAVDYKDALSEGDRVVLVDDLLATGGTALAGARLVERLGGKVVKMVFPIELEGFGAVKGKLAKYDVVSLVKYPGK